MSNEQVILVAFQVTAPDRETAQEQVMAQLPTPDGQNPLVAWWIAEDDRIDGSDNDSAVFVPYQGRK